MQVEYQLIKVKLLSLRIVPVKMAMLTFATPLKATVKWEGSWDTLLHVCISSSLQT